MELQMAKTNQHYDEIFKAKEIKLKEREIRTKSKERIKD
jgi:hypothetical protein